MFDEAEPSSDCNRIIDYAPTGLRSALFGGLECVEGFGAEELTEGYSETVTELLDGADAGVFAFAVEDALYGCLGDTGYDADAVRRESSFFAEFSDAFCNCFSCVHVSFFLSKYPWTIYKYVYTDIIIIIYYTMNQRY